jgi:hypothetical protein
MQEKMKIALLFLVPLAFSVFAARQEKLSKLQEICRDTVEVSIGNYSNQSSSAVAWGDAVRRLTEEIQRCPGATSYEITCRAGSQGIIALTYNRKTHALKAWQKVAGRDASMDVGDDCAHWGNVNDATLFSLSATNGTPKDDLTVYGCKNLRPG